MKLLAALLLAATLFAQQKPLRVRAVTGGHDYEPSFYKLLDGHPEFKVLVRPHPDAFPDDMRKSVDVLLLYDSVQTVPEKQKQNLVNFLEAGKGVVILHHALVDFADWEWWWKEVMGGLYDLKVSKYLHDVDMTVTPKGSHPIVAGLKPFQIHDETYKYLRIGADNQVLLTTDHPTSDGPVAWISPYRQSRVVVIQLGHGREAHEHPVLREIVKRAILWSAGK
ncbi:MAG: ThuA domain-containing protein [Bryobacteraceae bacterium]|nr:ThuA domain-containing protein [Bryobacteraceae bacterium]